MNSDEFRTEGELDLGELLKDEMLFSSAESNMESSICNKLRQFNILPDTRFGDICKQR